MLGACGGTDGVWFGAGAGFGFALCVVLAGGSEGEWFGDAGTVLAELGVVAGVQRGPIAASVGLFGAALGLFVEAAQGVGLGAFVFATGLAFALYAIHMLFACGEGLPAQATIALCFADDDLVVLAGFVIFFGAVGGAVDDVDLFGAVVVVIVEFGDHTEAGGPVTGATTTHIIGVDTDELFAESEGCL